MTAMGMVLSSLGIKITDEQRAQIETLIPQIPGKLMEVIAVINASVVKVNENTAAIEAMQESISDLKKDFGILCELMSKAIQEIQQNGRNYDQSPDASGTVAGAGADTGSSRYVNGNPRRKRPGITGS